MCLIDRVHTHKAKLKKDTNDDTFRHKHNPGTPEGHRPITSHFNIINKFVQKLSKQVNVDSDNHSDGVKNLNNITLVNVNS